MAVGGETAPEADDRPDREKRVAAARAVELVEDGMVLGLGTGSTAAHFVRMVGARIPEGLRVAGVPTSETTASLAREVGIPLATLDAEPLVDLTVDGVDEVDAGFRAIKGGGGALLREKIVACASARVVYVADSSKLVERLGAFPLPVEVTPFALSLVRRRISALGCQPTLRVRDDGAPFRTDEGNLLLDCPFRRIEDPEKLAVELDAMTGVVEHGLFLGLIDCLIVGEGETTRVIGTG